MQKVCSPHCARLYVEQVNAKADRKQTRAALEKLKTARDWINDAQRVANTYVRWRDYGKCCISCGSKPEQVFGGSMDAGHYLSRGSSPHLRLNLWNIALQCVKDNRYLGGVAIKFRVGLIQRIGVERVEVLESTQGPAKFTIDYLKRYVKVIGKKARRERARKIA